jgi:hypothetical protein
VVARYHFIARSHFTFQDKTDMLSRIIHMIKLVFLHDLILYIILILKLTSFPLAVPVPVGGVTSIEGRGAV